jgi:hypothetical protein|nr:MAG TPA: hypothetical protein [Caudoviricetes sp.]
MRYAVFRDGDLEQVLDHADIDAIVVAMNGRSVDILAYNQFISGMTDSLESADGLVEIVGYEDKWFANMLDKEIEKTKRTLRRLESLREDYDGGSD